MKAMKTNKKIVGRREGDIKRERETNRQTDKQKPIRYFNEM